jgi:hypothetical protein
MASISHLPTELIQQVAEHLPWDSFFNFSSARLFIAEACSSSAVLMNNLRRHVGGVWCPDVLHQH